MTLSKITYDILKLLTRFKITDDTRVTPLYLEEKVAQYRSEVIRKIHDDTGEISPSWLQPLGMQNLTKVTAGDDPNISGCNCTFAKITIPQVVGLSGDMGVYRVSSLCRTKKYYPISVDRFLDLDKRSYRANHKYYFRIGLALYLTPWLEDANVDLILDNPLTGWKMRTENILSGSLIVGVVYKVVSGNVVHGGTRYFRGSTFTATSNIFTGAGLVQYNVQKVLLTADDEYPMDNTLRSYIIMNILRNDFGIEAQEVSDTTNDGQDESNIQR